MNPSPHHIRRQRIELRAPDSDTAFALRAQMRRDVDDVLLPALSQALDAAALAAGIGDATVRIPRLAVSLRVRHADHLSQSLAMELPVLIAEQLEVALSGVMTSVSAQRQTLAERRHSSLLHYLVSGQLDWPEAQGDSALQATRLREEALQLVIGWQKDVMAMQRVLPVQYTHVAAFFFRLLQLLPSGQREASVAVLRNTSSLAEGAQRAKIVQGLREIAFTTGLPHYNILSLQAQAMSVVWADSLPPMAIVRREICAAVNAHDIEEFVVRIFDDVDAASSATSRESAIAPRSAQQRPRKSNRPDAIDEPDSTSHTQQTDRHATDEIMVQAHSLPRPAEHLAHADDTDAVAQRVHAAGLVLAHPFLPNLLAARGLLAEGGKSVLASKLAQAAALLHYLATGREEVYEFELGVIKALLGLRPTTHLPIAQGLLDEADREECSALLGAMISHWPALRTTSAAGLQVSFLQRQGLLREIDSGLQSGWQLQLESESFDILLAQLPWSISIVRLPWMTKPIFTEWQTR